jgi:hypothetical protein
MVVMVWMSVVYRWMRFITREESLCFLLRKMNKGTFLVELVLERWVVLCLERYRRAEEERVHTAPDCRLL